MKIETQGRTTVTVDGGTLRVQVDAEFDAKVSGQWPAGTRLEKQADGALVVAVPLPVPTFAEQAATWVSATFREGDRVRMPDGREGKLGPGGSSGDFAPMPPPLARRTWVGVGAGGSGPAPGDDTARGDPAGGPSAKGGPGVPLPGPAAGCP